MKLVVNMTARAYQISWSQFLLKHKGICMMHIYLNWDQSLDSLALGTGSNDFVPFSMSLSYDQRKSFFSLKDFLELSFRIINSAA